MAKKRLQQATATDVDATAAATAAAAAAATECERMEEEEEEYSNVKQVLKYGLEHKKLRFETEAARDQVHLLSKNQQKLEHQNKESSIRDGSCKGSSTPLIREPAKARTSERKTSMLPQEANGWQQCYAVVRS